MLFTPIYIAMTFIKTWRIRSFRARLLEFLGGNTSVAFCKVPENAAETPTLSSKLCTNPKNAYLCDVLEYTNATRICSMKPHQSIEIGDWVSCGGGLPLGREVPAPVVDVDSDVELLFECEMEPHFDSYQDVTNLESIGHPVAWKAGTHLAVVLRTNMENFSMIGFNFVGGEYVVDHNLPVVRIQTVQLVGEPNKATDPSMRSLRSEIQQSLKQPPSEFQWQIHAALLRKLSKVVDVKSETRNNQIALNGNCEHSDSTPARRNVMLADVSCNTGKSLNADDESDKPDEVLTISIEPSKKALENSPSKKPLEMSPSKKALEKSPERNIFDQNDERKIVLENVTVEIQHNITPKKSSLRLDLKKGASQFSSSLMNISSQIKSVTTHKRIVSSTGPKKVSSSHPQIECIPQIKEDSQRTSSSQHLGTPKTTKHCRPLVNTKSPNVLIYSDSVAARDNLEASLGRVLDCERYTLYSVTHETLAAGAWRGRAALVAVAGDVGRCAPLLLAHLLDGGRLLALCSDLLHTVLPYYKTAEIRENEVVQFSFDKWKSVKMKHHIFCYQASPAKKQFSTESDRQPAKYTGHPGHELAIQVLASEETWRTPSLLQATDLTNKGVAIFSQIHLEADPREYLGEEGATSNEARLQIIRKVLGDILGLHVRERTDLHRTDDVHYTSGYFLGNHVHKLSLIKGWCGRETGSERAGRQQQLEGLVVDWLMRDEAPRRSPAPDYLPVHVYECPEHFNTVEYFENLTSSSLGRLVVYADLLASTMAVTDARLAHGVGAVARQQTAGRGRGGNLWITPCGQAAMSLQVWQKVSHSLSLVQLAAALAVVQAIRSHPPYSHLNLRIKWPNDIYYGRDVKIGGVITTANCMGDEVIINIGTGVNISNSAPTTCVNDIIAEYNRLHGTSLAPMSIEMFLARYCSRLEEILDCLARGGENVLLEQYYQYWLHDGEKIRVLRSQGPSPIEGHITGVDPAGWLLVQTPSGTVQVAPDGNTFDIMQGLIAPKM